MITQWMYDRQIGDTGPWAPGHQPATTTAPEPMPEPLSPTPPSPAPEPIRTGACPFYVLVVSDDDAGNPGGYPIVWEHQMPAGTTLQAALQHQQRVAGRYGTTYLAECRIIPETVCHGA